MYLKTNPILFRYIQVLKRKMNIQLVHRREKRQRNSVEFILPAHIFSSLSGRINTLPEAEACGYWAIVRQLATGKRKLYHGHTVYQLYLSPVHHVHRHKLHLLADTASTFTPVQEKTARQRRTVSAPACVV